MLMRFIQLVPAKGTFTPGEIIRIVAEVAGEMLEPAVIQLSIYHLTSKIDTLTGVIMPENSEPIITFEWQAPRTAPYGYGVIAVLMDRSGKMIDSISTAFDILPDWTIFPRYGFLTDFSPNRTELQETIAALAQFHINGLQFYDWQYRHDQLLPPQPEYVDPLGRSLSLDTIRKFIEAAHRYGMAAMPYLAVYAASVEFWQAHPGWALYDANDQPITFEGFLGLMDPSPDSPWSNHLLGQCREVLRGLPFDGLHVDQYGDPKTGFNVNGELVDLPKAFVDFIQNLKVNYPRAVVVFNAVGNWPIEELVTAPQDFVYIEIWPPDVYFRDVCRIVANARTLSGGKPVVIALYLSACHPENVRLADALIFSLGGSRIELGEHVRLLADPYFPKHQALSADFTNILRRYYDFLVRYGEFLGPKAELLENIGVKAPPHVWVSIRSCLGWLVLSVINMSGLDDPRWDEEQSSPTPLTDVFFQLIVYQKIRQAWWASPDLADISLFPLPWKKNHHTVNITLPELDHWAIIAFELETTE
jgi:dextranase